MDGANTSEQPRKRSKWELGRLVLAAILSIVILVVLALTYMPGRFQVCREELTDAGIPQRLCGPAGSDDLVLVGAAFFIVILLI